MTTSAKIVRLTDRESRLLHAIERSIVHWDTEVKKRNYAGRDEAQRDLCVSASRDMEELRSILMEE